MGPGVCAIFSRKIRRPSAYLPFWLNVGWKNNFVKEEKTNSYRIHFDTAFQETCRFFVVMESRIAGLGPGPCPAVSRRNVAEIRIFEFPR